MAGPNPLTGKRGLRSKEMVHCGEREELGEKKRPEVGGVWRVSMKLPGWTTQERKGLPQVESVQVRER